MLTPVLATSAPPGSWSGAASHEGTRAISRPGLSGYRPDIDGLRAVAVLSVVVFHAFPFLLPGGFIGVDVFFVISGYLISLNILRDIDKGSFSIVDFYARRVRRIFPALLVVITVTLFIGSFFLLPNDLKLLGEQALASSTFVANFYFWMTGDYFGAAAPSLGLLHLWSLGVEEQFYIVWPLVLLLTRRKKLWLPTTLCGIGLASFAACFATSDETALFFLPTYRFWELIIGCILAWITMRDGEPQPRPIVADSAVVLGLTLIIASALLLDNSVLFPGWHALPPTFGAMIVIWGGQVSRVARLVLASKWPVFIGLISYPLYLWHWPALWFIRQMDPFAGPWKIGAACVGAFALAWATYAILEIRARKRSARFAAGLVGAMGCLAATSALLMHDGWASRWGKDHVALIDYHFDLDRSYRVGSCHLTPAEGPDKVTEDCFGDNPAAPNKLVLWGDSAATALYQGLRRTNDGSFDIAELTASACPPFVGDYVPFESRPNCKAVNEQVLAFIRKSRPAVVVISLAPIYRTDLRRHSSETIDLLKRAGVGEVVVVGPPPIWPTSFHNLVIDAFLRNKAVPLRLPLPKTVAGTAEKWDAELRRVAEEHGAAFVSVLRTICDAASCVATVDGEPTAWDQIHLTNPASALVAREIYAILRQDSGANPANHTGNTLVQLNNSSPAGR